MKNDTYWAYVHAYPHDEFIEKFDAKEVAMKAAKDNFIGLTPEEKRKTIHAFVEYTFDDGLNYDETYDLLEKIGHFSYIEQVFGDNKIYILYNQRMNEVHKFFDFDEMTLFVETGETIGW